MDHQNYKVLDSISVRKDKDSNEFIDWNSGDILGPKGLDYPDNLSIEELLLFKHIELLEGIEEKSYKETVSESSGPEKEEEPEKDLRNSDGQLPLVINSTHGEINPNVVEEIPDVKEVV